MKKFLSIVAAVGLTATAATSVVSCTNKNSEEDKVVTINGELNIYDVEEIDNYIFTNYISGKTLEINSKEYKKLENKTFDLWNKTNDLFAGLNSFLSEDKIDNFKYLLNNGYSLENDDVTQGKKMIYVNINPNLDFAKDRLPDAIHTFIFRINLV